MAYRMPLAPAVTLRSTGDQDAQAWQCVSVGLKAGCPGWLCWHVEVPSHSGSHPPLGLSRPSP